MAQDVDLEAKVITRFVVKAKRARYLAFITSPTNRKKLIADLHSATTFLRMDVFDQVMGSEEEAIEHVLRAHRLATNTC